jgi:hypothetical protein
LRHFLTPSSLPDDFGALSALTVLIVAAVGSGGPVARTPRASPRPLPNITVMLKRSGPHGDKLVARSYDGKLSTGLRPARYLLEGHMRDEPRKQDRNNCETKKLDVHTGERPLHIYLYCAIK